MGKCLFCIAEASNKCDTCGASICKKCTNNIQNTSRKLCQICLDKLEAPIIKKQFEARLYRKKNRCVDSEDAELIGPFALTDHLVLDSPYVKEKDHL